MHKDKRFWNFMMNLAIVKWFVNLPLCKKVSSTGFGKKFFCYETVTYLFFGVLATVLNIVVFFAFNWMLADKFAIVIGEKTHDVGYLIANFIAWIITILFAFVTNKLIVFRSKDMSKSTVIKEFTLFTTARIISLVFEMVWLLIAVSMAGMNELLAKIIANVIVVIINYILSKVMVFKKPKEDETIKGE